MKLAIVHDWIKDISGAERVLLELHKMYPDAPIYTLFHDEKFTKQLIPHAEIRASFLQKFPFILRKYALYSWLMPAAIESFDLSDFDTVISSSAIFSKGLVLRPQTRHICYCYSPSRFLWDRHAEYVREKDTWTAKLFQHLLRLWDKSASERPTEFIAISQTVADRIKKYYGRDSTIIYPPVDIGKFGRPLKTPNNFYLIVSRLYPHKNIDIAIEAFNKIGYPLIVIGDGPDRKRLERIAGKNITFLGRQSDETVASYYLGCRAFIMPQEEDFGLTPIEAMSFGKPVVALARGGATETIIEGVTGEFFDDPIPEGLADAVRRLNQNYSNYQPEKIKEQAQKFSSEKFASAIQSLLVK